MIQFFAELKWVLMLAVAGAALYGALLLYVQLRYGNSSLIPSVPPPPPPSRTQLLEVFCKREHMVFHEGNYIGKTLIRPVVRELMRDREIHLQLNDAASEPRWEATLGSTMAFHGNPNDAVLQCVALHDAGLIR